MLEERYIEVLAYNLETVLAEKLETVIARNITNTRMRDFYDIYVLLQLYGDTLNSKVLKEALIATTTKRATEYHLDDLAMIFDEVEDDFTIQKCLLHNRITQSCKAKMDIVACPNWT